MENKKKVVMETTKATDKKDDVNNPSSKTSRILTAIIQRVNREGVSVRYNDHCDHHEYDAYREYTGK